jgi:hypothetical protein
MPMPLAVKLIEARESLGLTLSEAVDQMPNTGYGTLQHLEGRAKMNGALRTPPEPSTIQIRTAVDIVYVYWPAIQLVDLVPEVEDLYFSTECWDVEE